MWALQRAWCQARTGTQSLWAQQQECCCESYAWPATSLQVPAPELYESCEGSWLSLGKAPRTCEPPFGVELGIILSACAALLCSGQQAAFKVLYTMHAHCLPALPHFVPYMHWSVPILMYAFDCLDATEHMRIPSGVTRMRHNEAIQWSRMQWTQCTWVVPCHACSELSLKSGQCVRMLCKATSWHNPGIISLSLSSNGEILLCATDCALT